MNYTSDYYAQKAKNEHYNARSVYKLKEIDKKFLSLKKHSFTQKNIRVLDLGAAPGSWTQYLLNTLHNSSHIVSVDITPIQLHTTKKHATLHTITGDFTTTHIISHIEKLGPYNYIISDAAPSTTGNKTLDTTASEFLVESAFEISKQFLCKNGIFVAKIFQGAGLPMLLKEINTVFKKTTRFKPHSARSRSFELYLICR